ncbi:capping protein-inhibiting regulator of actin dynamics [Ctenodactylus gundi]
MATEEIKLTKSIHSEALSADVSDKKKGGKFQPFKKLFGKRKKKNTASSPEESVEKKSYSPQSLSNGIFSSDEETPEDNLRSFNYSMGTRAFSHDSIFIPDGGAESEQTVQAMSQDNILGKVKTLQRHLGKNIKFGQRPSNAIPMKKAGSGEASSEEDLFLTSPLEIVAQQDIILSDSENKSSDTPSSPSPLDLPGVGSEMEEKVTPVKPSRPKRHFSSAGTIESVNLDAIPLAIARLDNSAAKHKLSVKPKNQRVSKKHRRFARDQQNEPGLESQASLDRNGPLSEDKDISHEEEPQPVDAEEDKRRQEDYWRALEAQCKRQKAEAAAKRRLEEQRLQALERRLWEENRRQELVEEGDEQRPRLEEERGPREGQSEGPERLEAEEQWLREEAERLEELRRRQEEERELQELRRLQALEAQQREAERQWREEEARREEEEARKREEEEARKREEEEVRKREEEEARKREEEEVRKREEEEARKREEEEARKREAEARKREEEARKREAEARKREEEEARKWEAEARKREAARRQKELEEEKRLEELEAQRELNTRGVAEAVVQVQQKAEKTLGEARPSRVGERQLRQEDGSGSASENQEGSRPREDWEGWPEPEAGPAEAQPGERGDLRRPRDKRRETARAEATSPEKDRKVEELRWQEVDERQTMPRAYTFQVSSGGRQILFPKVNLSPVTPAKDEAPTAPEPKASRGGTAHALPSALSIPHTAILVTGAQLCGPAVNLSQIKDTACKSLLGLAEEKRHVDVSAAEHPPRAPGEPRAGGARARPAQEVPGSAAALAEWASIRSRILRTAEGDLRGERDEPGPSGRSDSRGNLRKTPPANVKFSITPAWQKFSDGAAEPSRPSAEAEGRHRSAPAASNEAASPPPAPPPEPRRSPERRREPADATEGCKFAKDLPSFLVPSLPSALQKAAAHPEAASPGDGDTGSGEAKPEPAAAGGEEKASPFGIKLRRTNYSLRFHCDQQAEQKKKKRHGSTGDGADAGLPAGERESEAAAAGRQGPAPPQDRKTASTSRKDSAESAARGPSPGARPGPPPSGSQAPAPEQDKAAHKVPPAQKPALAPKPAGQTPPSSPLSRLSRPYLVELLARRAGKPEPEPGEPVRDSQESRDTQPPSPPPAGRKRDEDEETPERKAAPPPLPAAQPERLSPTPETGRKEKPVLQSRHSLDGSKLTEKVETAQPLWITLALQKQKGFREQQATREERKQAREAKQAEKLSKDNVSVSPQPASGSLSRAGSLHKSSAQPEEKKPETAVSRLERREQLKKANTLPTSVTVEISDSAPTAPLVKEVTKRFSTPDATPVSTEPAWLALAKRKAKAWSDCPQIIK